MSTRTPAARLARLRILYPNWVVRRASQGPGFVAIKPSQVRGAAGRVLVAPTVDLLDARLHEAEPR